jgi:hypothetical protein
MVLATFSMMSTHFGCCPPLVITYFGLLLEVYIIIIIIIVMFDKLTMFLVDAS